MSKTNKNKQNSNYRYPIIIILIGVAVIVLSLVFCSSVKLNYCTKYNGVISDYKYDVIRRQGYISFNINNEKFCCYLNDYYDYDDAINSFSEAKNSKETVTVSVNYKENLSITNSDKLHAVDIRSGDKVYYNIEDYNSTRRNKRILFVLVGAFISSFGFAYMILIKKLS